MAFTIGDSCRVHSSLFDEDLNCDIQNWEGRVISIEEDTIVTIQWDSVTLKNIPKKVIDHCEENDIDWQEITLSVNDLESSEPRDTEDDVEDAIDELEDKHYWSYLGEQGRRIKFVLGTTERDDLLEIYRLWGVYLQKECTIPFKAVVTEIMDEESPIHRGDHITIVGIDGYDEADGVIMWVEYEDEEYTLPLFILEAADQSSKNYELVDDYYVCFENLSDDDEEEEEDEA